MDFDFVPWGNAYFAAVTGNKTYDRGPGMTSWLEQCGMGVKSPPADCFTGEILCRKYPADCERKSCLLRDSSAHLTWWRNQTEHGPNECKGNLIEGWCVSAPRAVLPCSLST